MEWMFSENNEKQKFPKSLSEVSFLYIMLLSAIRGIKYGIKGGKNGLIFQIIVLCGILRTLIAQEMSNAEGYNCEKLDNAF